MPVPSPIWVRARTEADVRLFKRDREIVAAQAKPPLLTRYQNRLFWGGLVALMVLGFVLGVD